MQTPARSTTQKAPAVQFIEITDSNAGQRIDNFLLSLQKGVPKSRIYRAIRKGEVRVNKGRIKATYKLQLNDIVRLPPLRISTKVVSSHLSDSLRQILTDSILFEDDDLLVINKPSGLAVHAGSKINQGVIEALKLLRPELPFLELIHRLDRDTSGCLLLAKNRISLLEVQDQFRDHTIDKRYLTLMKGAWLQGEKEVNAPLLKQSMPTDGDRMVRVDAAGKSARTLFIPRDLYRNGQGEAIAQFTEVVLYTGRTHQIRVHSAHIGHPLAADDKYGNRLFNRSLRPLGLKRLFLHAWQLTIQHPTSGQPLHLEAPLPTELSDFLNTLKHGRNT